MTDEQTKGEADETPLAKNTPQHLQTQDQKGAGPIAEPGSGGEAEDPRGPATSVEPDLRLDPTPFSDELPCGYSGGSFHMHAISNRFLRLAVLAALIGMTWGAIMGARQDFALASAHAHLNLLGWVSMTLYGLFYRVVPTAADGLMPRAHFWVALAGVVVFVPSLAIVLLHAGPYLALAERTIMLATLLLIVSMLLFAVIVFRATGRAAAR